MGKSVEVDQDVRARNVLTQYWGEIAAEPVFFHGIRGGFSGSRVWKVGLSHSQAAYLKKWPTIGPSASRLALIHRVLTQIQYLQPLREISPLRVTVPIRNCLGDSITQADGHLWELSPEISGTPKRPADLQKSDIDSAMQTVAEIHLALDQIGRIDPTNWPYSGCKIPSPGLKRRSQWLERIREDLSSFSRLQPPNTAPSNVQTKFKQLLEAALPLVAPSAVTAHWIECKLPIQPCIRDLWYAHVLFDKSQVTGIIDFGSIGEDCVVTDLARLLRSWIPQEAVEFRLAIASYQKTRGLTEVELASLEVFDRTARVLSAFQWIEWLAVERREFEDWEAVSDRLDFVLARLPHRN